MARRVARIDKCKPFSKILVKAFAPGTLPEIVNCTSSAAFIVYGTTNGPGAGYSISVKSTGFTFGTGSPTFVVGATARDTITFQFLPGVTGVLTLQTECGARASMLDE